MILEFKDSYADANALLEEAEQFVEIVDGEECESYQIMISGKVIAIALDE